MDGRDQVEQLRRLYGDNLATAGELLGERLRKQMPELGECLAGQLAELSRDPSRERCDRVLQSLAGVIAHVRQLAASQEAHR